MSKEIIVIGGGAAGFMAAIAAREKGADVVILEKKDRVLKKVLATGNGRCNYTNVNTTLDHYYSNSNIKLIENTLAKFTSEDTLEFFEDIGIVPYEEEKGKIYPNSLQSSSIVDALRLKAESLGIEIECDYPVSFVKKKKDLFEVGTSNGKYITGDAVIIATGGKSSPSLGSDGSGFHVAEKLGHTITELKPALVQLKTDKHSVKGLSGIKWDVKIKGYSNREYIDEGTGELLFTDYGISGPVVFDLSYLTALYDDISFKIDFFPDLTYEELVGLFMDRKECLSYLTMENFLNGFMNKKLGQFLSKKSGIEKLSLPVKDLTNEIIIQLASIMKEYRIEVKETTGFKSAQVTAGGVVLKEVHCETLESRIVEQLYFAGEVLDVFGDCGGYNLQWAWASGFLAGNKASE